MASFMKDLKNFADWRDQFRPQITSATIEVTEDYARRKLKLKKKDTLVYRGLRLRCIGSRAWRDLNGAGVLINQAVMHEDPEARNSGIRASLSRYLPMRYEGRVPPTRRKDHVRPARR